MASREGATTSTSSSREVAMRRPHEPMNGNELPFLVTHWLQNFNPDATGGEGEEANQNTGDGAAKRAAMDRIRRATSELASAFTALGAYGSSAVPSLNVNNIASQPNRGGESSSSRNATYADLNRRWATALPPNHLNHLVDAAVSSTVAAEDVVSHCAESNLVHAANEAIVKQRRNPSSGRTVQDAIDIENDKNNNNNETTMAQLKPSILHRPTHVDFNFDSSGKTNEMPQSSTHPKKMPALSSQLQQLQTKSSQAMRHYLDLKVKFESEASEMRTLKASLGLHSRSKETLQQARLAGGASLQTADMEISEEEQNADRVLAQLQRKIGELEKTNAQTAEDFKSAKKDAHSQYNDTKQCLLNCRDPIREATQQRPGFGMKAAQNQGILHALESRRLGLHNRLTSKRALPNMESSAVKTNHIRNALLESRLSHAVTINAHCHNPVYSVRFDRTGRFFITGADDNLIKVFQTRAKQTVNANGKGVLGQGQDQTIRGAVLVCTFRGHASVINEIDVSSDNCFLATASEDGDCRVWGLLDGTPIAILRGHVGGCNAVSWSKLTPYRLLTAGHDGFARCWDIRLAALKRYSAVLGKRPEYCLPLTQEERASNAELRSTQQQDDGTNDAVNLPPIPERQSQLETESAVPAPPADQLPLPAEAASAAAASFPAQAAAAALPDQAAAAAPPPLALPNPPPAATLPDPAAAAAPPPPPPALPNPPPPAQPDQGPALPDEAPLAPLPPPAANAGGGGAAAAGADDGAQGAVADNIAQPGLFVQNDMMDEGVRLVGKFQHGTVTEEQIAGPGTRSGRGKIKVLLFARCPLGGHFATGASDGTCRIWEDIDDPDVETVDRRFSNASFDSLGDHVALKERMSRRSSRTTGNRLLLELKGFVNPTTDLQYSHAGDKILVGSMQDGVFRIWSWDVDPAMAKHGNAKSRSSEKGLRNVTIKLTNPLKSSSSSTKSTRRRARGNASNSASKILLDMAVWTNDDSKIITSQSQPVNSTKIEPNSNFMFLWDSKTGHCLLGIAGGHSNATPVILPHPSNASIFCSGGSDGFVKVWDCETGKCLFSHKNEHQLRYLIDATPNEPCGLINDGAFFPDGTGFLLSDSSGNVLVFDSIVPASEQPPSSGPSLSIPSLPHAPVWMKEQYRANDYYDLKYETNGYCVEQGSNLPPHLAPRGVRCTHAGAPFSDTITEAFENLVGPQPVSISDGQWFRQAIRFRASERMRQGSLGSSKSNRRGNIMQEWDPLTTVLVRGTGEIIETRNEKGEIVTPASVVVAARTPAVATVAAAVAHDLSEQRRSNSGRLLSSNYRWRDYSDMLREERFDGADDSDDEEFQPAARSAGTPRSESSLRVDSDESDDEMDLESPRRRPAQRPPQQRSAQVVVTRQNPQSEEQRPSRSSNRRLAIERNRYEEPDSDDDAEFVSTNNDPSGPYIEDYTKHFFRLPPNGPPIARQWLKRLESDPGYQGRKTYSPQLGDTVVYIPRAHFEWIQAFPSLKVPWQHWPSGSEWPVVCCCIRNIRYRFPFSDYYGNRNTNRNECNSVIAILSLEVTGIPVLSQERDFNWPDPHFIPPARSHLFELDLFESEFEEFLIPYDRYVWRLQCLEEAIINNHGLTEGIEISAYYENEENETPDSDLILYKGHLDEYAQLDHTYNDENLNNCGYGTVRIRWPENDQQDTLSPWEVIVEKPKSRRHSLSRHCLSDEDKKRAREALKKLKCIPSVREQLMFPVDERRYVDYSLRVEVPLCLNMVESRLSNNYYSTRWSIVADVQLIRDNCIKYNGEVGLLQDEARQMYNEFEKEMLDEEERQVYNDLKTITTSSPARESRGSRSSLENLPPPEVESGPSQRRSLRIRIDAAALQAAEATTGRALRSNSQAPDFPREQPQSASFAQALQSTSRRRQSRRGSNGGPSVEPRARGQRGRVAAAPVPAPAIEPGRRRSSRMLERETQLDTENVANNSRPQRRRSRGTSGEAPAAAARQSRSRSAPADEEPASESESDAKPAARPRRSSTRHAAVEHSESEQESALESESEHMSSQQPSRRSSRARKSSAKYEEEFEEPPTPKKTRKRKARDVSDESEEEKRSYYSEEFQSASEAESEVSTPRSTPAKRSSARASDRNNSTATTPTGRNTNSRTRAQAPSPSRRSSRGGRVSYAENSESEFEEPPSEDEVSEDEDQMLSPHKRSARSRRAAKKPASRKRPAAKKKKVTKTKSKKQKAKSRPKKRKREEEFESEESDDAFETPVTPRTTSRSRRRDPWPDIDQKHITRVTMGMLDYLRNMDEANVFENPVLESNPEISVEYLQRVSTPMDFRTIEEERLNYYSSISELQHDLHLIFENCIHFNGDLSEYGQFAQQMIDMLDDAFENIAENVVR